MKHLFYVHSHVAKLVSEMVVKYEGINNDDVVFILFRNMDFKKNEFHVEKFPFGDEISFFRLQKNLIKVYKKLYYFNKFIDELTSKEPFLLYAPRLNKTIIQLLVHKKKCIGYSLLEEGSASYLTKEKADEMYLEWKVNIFEKIGYLGKAKQSKFVDSNYQKVYGLSEYSFPEYKRKVNLWDNFKSYDYNSRYSKYDGSSIIILDGTSMYGDVSQGINVYSTYIILNELKKNNQHKIFYKHHPRQYGELEEVLYDEIFRKYSSKLNIKKIDSDTSIEMIMLNARNLKIYINASSLGIYGLMLGHKVYSTSKKIKDIDNNVLDQINMYPSDMINKIYYL